MRALLRRLTPYLLRVRRDRRTGHLFYRVDGVRLHIRFPEEAVRERWRRAAFEEIYFKHYRPSGTDCVVDFGAGLGTEIVPLARLAPRLRYIAVEVQPWVYECLCLTLAQLPEGYRPFGVTLGDGAPLLLDPSRSGIDVSTSATGAVPVETIGWGDFTRRHGIDRVDLLKINVEGAEVDLLHRIDLDQVARVIVGTHDFRADRGEGEHFRTCASVEARLREVGFRVRPLPNGWLFADRVLS